MATEHEIGESERGRHIDGTRTGWGDSSSCRYYPSSAWGSWGNIDIPSSGGDAHSSRDDRGEFGSSKASEAAEDGWGMASESADDGWGEVSHGAESPKVSWGKASESAGDGWGDLYDPDCEVEELQEAESSIKCSGLTNLGNTCFMNSVLQCLTYTVPFANRILDSQHRLSCKAEFCALCAIENHINVVLTACGKTVTPAFLADNLDQISRTFVPGQQQDAHEFLLFLLEGMQQQCKTEEGCQSQSLELSDTFMGQMKSQVKCKSCSHCSDSAEPFLGLNLEIENCESVKEALSNFMAVEDLQEEVKVTCPQCKQAVSRSKQLSFNKSPEVLIVQLKRYKASEFFPTKIERDIKYDTLLDLTPFVSQEDAGAPIKELDWNYSLYAVLVHSGWSTSSGHYYCFVQTSPGLWHCLNDSLVSRVRERTVLLQEAYILFYIRKGFNEKLKLENAHLGDEDLGPSKGPQLQTPVIVAGRYLYCVPTRDDSVIDKGSPVNTDLKDLSKSLNSLDQKQVDMELEVDKVKTPGVSKQVVGEIDSGTKEALPAQQASNSKHLQTSSKRRSFCELDDPKDYPCAKKGSSEPEVPKHSPGTKIQSTAKAENFSSPATMAGPSQGMLDSFENGSQYSYVRLLNKMPSSRRQAFLASAMSGQEASKQSTPKATRAKEKEKPASNLLQARMGRATSKLLQKEEVRESKGKCSAQEKSWANDHDYVDTRNTQRVGGKRVLASFRSSDVH